MEHHGRAWVQDTTALLRTWDGDGDGLCAKLNAALVYERAEQYTNAIGTLLPGARRAAAQAHERLRLACQELALADAAVASLVLSDCEGASTGPTSAGAALRRARQEQAAAQAERNRLAHEAWLAEEHLHLLRTQLRALASVPSTKMPLLALVLEVGGDGR